MYSHASVRAVRYYRRSLCPLTQTRVMTHAATEEEEEDDEEVVEEEKKRCC